MIREKVKQAWIAVPSGVKRALGFTASIAGVVASVLPDEDQDSQSESEQSVYGSVGLFNHNTGKFDDGQQIGGMYGEPYDNQD